MAIKQLNPYLNFDGTAAQAIGLYERALDANVEFVQRFDEVPGMPASPEAKDRIVHARLRIGEGVLMISDSPPGLPVPTEGNVHVCLDFTDPVEMARRFERLADGGQVTMALQDTFWGAHFGMLTDRYGIRWMMNCTIEKS